MNIVILSFLLAEDRAELFMKGDHISSHHSSLWRQHAIVLLNVLSDLGWERCACLLTEVHILSCWSVPLTLSLSQGMLLLVCLFL